MSSPPTIEEFKGIGWEECNHFIRAIRAVAWKEGKLRDLAWTADFASLHFSHKALKWHCRLPQDVRENWAKLQVALLDRWSPPDDDDESRIEPTPAAAPSLSRSDKANSPPQGALKLVIDGFGTDYYLRIDSDGCAEVTDDANEALRIRCNPLANTTVLEQIDGSRHSWLGVQWRTTKPDLGIGSTSFGFMVLVDPLTLKSSWGEIFPYQFASCTVSGDGEVIPSWENGDTSKIPLGIFCEDGGGNLFPVADPSAYSKQYPSESRVKIFIKSID